MKAFRSSAAVNLLVLMMSTLQTFSSAFHSGMIRIQGTRHFPSTTDGFGRLPGEMAEKHRSTGTQTKLHYASPSIREVVQGSSLRVFPFSPSRNSRSLRIDMMTDGRPLEARAELWHGPSYCPQKIRVYSENGRDRPFRACIEAPSLDSNFAVAIQNTGKTFEFPLSAAVQDLEAMDESDANPFFHSELMLEEEDDTNGYGNVLSRTNGRSIQGGAIRSFNFAPKVDKVQVLLETSGLPLCARIEISQGPDNTKQVMDIYSEDGKRFPLYLAVDFPSSTGLGHVMRIINASTMEFPIKVWVDSYTTNSASPAVVSSDSKQLPRILEGSTKDGTDIPAYQVPKLEDSNSYQAQ